MYLLRRIRDFAWNYPDWLIYGKDSLVANIRERYQDSRPFSHIALTILLTLLFLAGGLTRIDIILGLNTDTFTEGVLVGTQASGAPEGLNKLNPFIVIAPQLDKDVIELIYQPLVKVTALKGREDPEIIPVLAENFTELEKDRKFRLNLRNNVKWHDGTSFSANDVFATFNLIKELEAFGVNDIYGSKLAKDMTIEALDDYRVEFTAAAGTRVPNFFELLDFKIIPSYKIDEFRDSIVNRDKPLQTITAIGTGPYRLAGISTEEVRLTAFPDYYLGKPHIENFKFRLLTSTEEAATAMRSGRIHGITNIDGDMIERLQSQKNLNVLYSPVNYSQYWALYFNLSEVGAGALKETKVRQAISLALDKRLAIEKVFSRAEVARGPIPVISPYYNEVFQQGAYNPEQAEKLLEEAGWKLGPNPALTEEPSAPAQVRQKGDQFLQFELVYLDNSDRNRVVNELKRDLEAVGILLKLVPTQRSTLDNVRNFFEFDLLMYGVSTFIDPDRYEFFHSSEAPGGASGSGLNIAGYKSSTTTVVIDPDTRQTVRVPVVDYILQVGRSQTEFAQRQSTYNEFQQELQRDTPVVFLYHPSLRYIVSKRVRNIDLNNVRFAEDRFFNVQNWEITYN